MTVTPCLAGSSVSPWKPACALLRSHPCAEHQVDMKKRVVRLSDTKNDSARTVPLSKWATETFQAALNNPIRPIDCDLVFFGEPGKNGKRSPYAFTKTWGLLKTKLGMPDLRFHDLRHEAVSRLVEGGLSDQEVSAISGHKSMQMLKRYTQAPFPRSYCGSDPFIHLFYVRALRPLRFLAHTRVDAYPRGDFFCGEDSDRRTFAAGGSAQRGGGNCSYRQPLLGLFGWVNFCVIVVNGFRNPLNEGGDEQLP
ncbi:Site-specific recombinase, phage integrase family [Pseudomonas amygdali pv. ulmi]|uniref:Site-specific recombinase, phage integrase family n=1 Tax=Pseudomonas amygdali pv. ulmi TaxID=251720 RepID=A0A3M4SU39_PSEA0|nr:Site-specific recombinase, phage integrase family [Pseudomonas amygdali pv. ulmi]